MSYPHAHDDEVIYFGRTTFRNQLRKFGIKTDDRRRHMYIIGKTGMGKTTLMENMILSDVYAGHGCAYIDPHGDTAERLIDFIPSWRINDVIYFNPADVDFPIGFNILEAISERHKHLVASGMMGVFKKIWENVWSARMEYILNNSILALLDNPGSTLLGINRMLSDADYRKKVISNVKDPIVKQFWVTEFASYNEKYAQEAVAPIQNKIGQFLSASIIRNIVAQVKSTINIREMLDEEKIFIVNLSKGRIGEDNSRLLGGMLITKLQLAAMERVDIPEAERKDFYMYVDEFQNFAVESFASILSEARKYRLCLIMAHQYVAQLSDEVREAVFGNVGTIVAYRVGAPDATFMETEFAPRFTPEDIINLPKYHVYLKLLIDGVTSQPFSAITLPPIAQRTASADRVVRVSRERYARGKSEIEEKILRWSGMGEDMDVDKLLAEAEEKKKTMKESRKPRFEYNCTRCNKQIVLPVELDRSRPIYCEDCIEIVRSERKASKERKKMKRDAGGGVAPKLSDGDAVEKFAQEVSVSLSALAPTVPKPRPVTQKPAPRPEPKPEPIAPVGIELPMPSMRFSAPPIVGVAQRQNPTAVAPSAPPATPSTQQMTSDDPGKKKRRRRRRSKSGSGQAQPQAPAPAPQPPRAPSQQPSAPAASGSLHSGQTIKFE
jgi:DNA-directed RNA polymerase subunit RPC12/RpoP